MYPLSTGTPDTNTNLGLKLNVRLLGFCDPYLPVPSYAGVYTFNDDKHDAASPAVEQKANNGKLTMEALTNNKDFRASTAAALKADVKVDAKSITLGTNDKYYVDSTTKYISVEKFGDDIDVTTATGGMKADATTNGIAIFDADDAGKTNKTALAVVYFGDSLNTSVSSESVVYVADKPTTKVSADNWEATLYFMDDNTTKDVTVDDNYEVGFYTFSEKDGVYELEAATLLGNSANLTYDDEEGALEDVTITGVYNKNGVSTITGTVTKNEKTVTLNDVSAKNLLVFDNRGDAKDNDKYSTEITTIGDLKDAVKDEADVHKVVKADLYLNDGVTFICITAVKDA